VYSNDHDKWYLRELNAKKFKASSSPFVADFNGDFLPDFLHNSDGKVKIAFQTKNP